MTEQLNLIRVEESLSPRLAWMKRHGVEISKLTEDESNNLTIKYGMIIGNKYMAWFTNIEGREYGDTEDDALCNLAESGGIPLWNEEQYAKEHK